MWQRVMQVSGRALHSSLRRASTSADPPPLIITESAVRRLKRVAEAGEHLRVSVEGGGCAGFEYKLALDRALEPDDVVVEKEGARVVVDQVSLPSSCTLFR